MMRYFNPSRLRFHIRRNLPQRVRRGSWISSTTVTLNATSEINAYGTPWKSVIVLRCSRFIWNVIDRERCWVW